MSRRSFSKELNVSAAAAAAGSGVRQAFRGLHLRTHPDNDVAARKVYLVHADEIVMDDGTRVADWDRLEADITVAGAGGLDTGAEAASTWYEIYAIRKSADGTKNLLLHRAKDYFLDESQPTSTSDGALYDAAARQGVAQGFQVDTAGPVSFVDVTIRKVGAPTNQFWFEIHSDSAGLPSGVVLATSDKLDETKLPTSNIIVRIVFRNPATLAALTQYHLVFKSNQVVDAANHLVWVYSNTNPYARGGRSQFSGAAWTATDANDYWFKVYVTRNDTTVTLPSGYDQKCKVGYVFNDSSSNFSGFIALDRLVRALVANSSGSATVNANTLFDFSAILPPSPLVVHPQHSNDSGASASVVLSGVPDGFGVPFTNDAAGGGSVLASVIAGAGHTMQPVHTDYQGVYINVNQTSTFRIRAWEW